MTTAISAQMVKELRDTTGAGMMDCKGALSETGGDMQAAIDWLRKKGLSKAAKKAGRIAADGLIGVVVAGPKGVLVEVNSETDFVARNDLFQGLVKMIAQVALKTGTDVEKIKAAPVGSATVEAAINENTCVLLVFMVWGGCWVEPVGNSAGADAGGGQRTSAARRSRSRWTTVPPPQRGGHSDF